MMIPIAYGRKGLEIEVPEANLTKILTMEGAVPLEDPDATTRQALREPVAGPPLGERARSARSACIVICDITRPVPNTIVLPPILETLEQAGIDRGRITILIATGLHRESTPEEITAMVGPEIRDRYRIVSHRARHPEEQRDLGLTGRGTPVAIDRVYCEADLKITTGFIEPHLMAGFSGGRKLVAPGCASERTIKALHSPLFIEDPGCREGSIGENPLHHELLEIAAMAGHDFIVNVTLDPRHRVTGLFAGEPRRAHEAGVAHARRAVGTKLGRPADIVITTSAGHPLDLTFYQAVKGLTAAMPVVRPGGLLIIAAECAEGLGSPEFTRMATSFRSAEEFVEHISRTPVEIDQWQLEECAKAARHAEVVLVSPTVAQQHGGQLFIRTAARVEDALDAGFRRLGSDASVAVIPTGPYTLVEVAEGQP
jgi:nickel-dependent lactate racemase